MFLVIEENDVGKVVECSSKPFGKHQSRLTLGSSIAHNLSDKVGIPALFEKKRRKQTKSNSLWVKKMRISNGPLLDKIVEPAALQQHISSLPETLAALRKGS